MEDTVHARVQKTSETEAVMSVEMTVPYPASLQRTLAEAIAEAEQGSFQPQLQEHLDLLKLWVTVQPGITLFEATARLVSLSATLSFLDEDSLDVFLYILDGNLAAVDRATAHLEGDTSPSARGVLVHMPSVSE